MEVRKSLRTLADFQDGDFTPALQDGPCPSIPEWMDWERFHRGQRFFSRNSHSVLTSNLISLLFIYMSPEHMYPMRVTGEVETPTKSCLRYLFTALHVKRWYEGNVFDPNDKAHVSIIKVRRMHASVMAKVNGEQSKKVYLSHCDMAFTQALFMGLVVISPRRLGVHSFTVDDMEGFIFFWRVIGHLLGIEPEYNLCEGDYDRASREISCLLDGFAKVRMRNLPPEFEQTSQVFADGFRRLNRNVVVRFLYYLVDEPCPFRLSWKELFWFWMMRVHFSLLMRIAGYADYFNKWTCSILDCFEKRMKAKCT